MRSYLMTAAYGRWNDGGKWPQGCISTISYLPIFWEDHQAMTQRSQGFAPMEICCTPWRSHSPTFPILLLQTVSHYLIRKFYSILLFYTYTQLNSILNVYNVSCGYKFYHPQNLDGKYFTVFHFSKTNYTWLERPHSSDISRKSISVINLPPFSSGSC